MSFALVIYFVICIQTLINTYLIDTFTCHRCIQSFWRINGHFTKLFTFAL